MDVAKIKVEWVRLNGTKRDNLSIVIDECEIVDIISDEDMVFNTEAHKWNFHRHGSTALNSDMTYEYVIVNHIWNSKTFHKNVNIFKREKKLKRILGEN